MLFKKKTVPQKLRDRSEWYLRDLPDSVSIPALAGQEPRVVLIDQASLDELAFVIVDIETQISQTRTRLNVLREAYEQARKRGGYGEDRLLEIFTADRLVEGSKS